jgi:hypothetical protein
VTVSTTTLVTSELVVDTVEIVVEVERVTVIGRATEVIVSKPISKILWLLRYLKAWDLRMLVVDVDTVVEVVVKVVVGVGAVEVIVVFAVVITVAVVTTRVVALHLIDWGYCEGLKWPPPWHWTGVSPRFTRFKNCENLGATFRFFLALFFIAELRLVVPGMDDWIGVFDAGIVEVGVGPVDVEVVVVVVPRLIVVV